MSLRRSIALRARGRAWGVLLLSSVALIGAVDSVILEVNTGYFSSGYGGAAADTLPRALAYMLAGAVADLAMVLALWTIALAGLRGLRARPVPTFCLAGFLGVAIPLALVFARHVTEVLIGRIRSLASLWELSGGGVLEVAAQVVDGMPSAGWLLLVGAAGSAIVLGTSRRLEARLGGYDVAAPRVSRVVAGALLCALATALVLGAPGPAASRAQFGLGRKPSATALRLLLETATDFDFDGTGLLARPPDPAPFDASVNAYALDLPGNGIDEDQLAGDLPIGFESPTSVVSAPLPEVLDSALPTPVVLVLLESFRADLIDARFEGREITPFLNRLAAGGARSEHAYAHTPHTPPSRAQLFGGTLTPSAGQSTLVDDFAARGYEVAYFSGQDDTFGGGSELLGYARASVFYDARRDHARHSGRGTSSGALQVSWKLLTQRVQEFLDQRDASKPLFLYVNLTDTHFPYHHDELDRIFDIEPIDRHSIRADRRDQVWATYVNSAANVDRAVERLVRALRAHQRGREPMLVVTADHGESIFDDGSLGHGQDLDEVQTHVPFIVSGLGGEWPDPVGLADVRGLLRRNLLWTGRPHFVADPRRTLFQVVFTLERPHWIALRDLAGSTTYDFIAGEGALRDARERLRSAPAAEGRRAVDRLIQTWEALRLRH